MGFKITSKFFVFKELADKYGYPVFIRSDQSSAKHSWDKSCYLDVDDMRVLESHIGEIILQNLCADIIGLPLKSIVFREFIPLEWKFKSHQGMPVAKEQRFFIKNGKIQCSHAYWPEWAIENPTIPNWKEELKKLNTLTQEDKDTLNDYVMRVAKVFDGYWSVDFAKGKNGAWYLIDMAEGGKSFHWTACEYCPQEQKEFYTKVIERKEKGDDERDEFREELERLKEVQSE